MRLLNTIKRELREFRDDKIPPYTILSHTWGDKEITFQDMKGEGAENKEEYEKIRKTCEMATAQGFEYIWIDTCCIDKSSSAELSEAINSMYRWYQESRVCYAYLADVPPDTIDHQNGAIGHEFSKSRWFTRGWTLQELIAPSTVIFLDQKWQEIGTKSSLQQMISKITNIPTNILLGADLEGASVAQRMSWASKRKTTRVEDLAYCLMGIFGINMSLLYGEGERAFNRLQEEIIKVSDDHSLFAWTSSEKHGGLLATSPAAFFKTSKIVPFNSSSTLGGAITVNNKGIHLKLHVGILFQDIRLAMLPCIDNGRQVAIYLRALSGREEYFVRILSDRLKILDNTDFLLREYHEKSICIRRERRIRRDQSLLPRAVANEFEAIVTLLPEKDAMLKIGSNQGWTMLSWAAENGNEAAVKLLLEIGAELEDINMYGCTALSQAAENGHEAVVMLLLGKGAEPETKATKV